MAAARLDPRDRARIAAAVAEAELATDGEIVTIVAERSDPYRDVAANWATLAMVFGIVIIAITPGHFLWVADSLSGWGREMHAGELLTLLLGLMTLLYAVARVALLWMPLRLALTPASSKGRRVRQRAIAYFRLAAERRTVARTGVLLYLSLAERRAEIVADEGLHGKVAPDEWGEAMALLIDCVREGRAGDGMTGTIARIGAILARHFPKTGGDLNELPDGVIEL